MEKLKGVMEESEFKGLDIDFKIVDKVPLTLTGKIDRKALRVYEETTMKNKSNVEKRIPPRIYGHGRKFCVGEITKVKNGAEKQGGFWLKSPSPQRARQCAAVCAP